MARSVFYSFDYKGDAHRVQLVSKMGGVAGQRILNTNEWESVEKGGKSAIKKWIDENMHGKSCVIVLIGRHTATREWVDYEIKKAWDEKRGLVGIYIHGLNDMNGQTTLKGSNPFSGWTVGSSKKPMDQVVPAHDPAGTTSKERYKTIEGKIESWVDKAIEIRKNFTG
jgi:MTH538 TIR-like domain (DUF1863)